jgi:CheY-like chemotaxis protein
LLPSQPPTEIPLPNRDRALEAKTNQLESPLPITADRNRLVLIVESVAHFIDRLSTQLISWGYRVVIARSGTEALEKARRLQPSLIFLNPLLPTLSGWDVLTLLKTSADTQSIPVIVTAMPVDEEQATRCNADGFLQIPIQTDLLRQAIGQLLAQQTKAALQTQDLGRPLTLLKLGLTSLNHESVAVDFNQVLQGYHYRLLEADDLEQGELLARVWTPDLVLLDGSPTDWLTFLHQLRLHTMLASRPLVTLDALAQSAAHQVPGLMVFNRPVAAEGHQIYAPNHIESCWLRLIQLAIGYIWQPVILTIDTTLWLDHSFGSQRERLCETEWAQALIQYLLTAGLRGRMSESRQEAMDLLQAGTVDLLLISWTDDRSEVAINEIAQTLSQLSPRPPLLILDHRSYEASPSNSPTLSESVCKIADRILPATLPMAELLDEVQALLSQAESLSKRNCSATTYPS